MLSRNTGIFYCVKVGINPSLNLSIPFIRKIPQSNVFFYCGNMGLEQVLVKILSNFTFYNYTTVIYFFL